MTPPGASGTPPPTTQSAGLLITANVRGGLGAGRPTSHFTTFRRAGLRPQLIHATLLGPGMPGPQPRHYHPFIFCIVGRGLDPSGGVGDAAPYILGRELSANRRGIHLSRFLARVSLTFFFTFPAKYATI